MIKLKQNNYLIIRIIAAITLQSLSILCTVLCWNKVPNGVHIILIVLNIFYAFIFVSSFFLHKWYEFIQNRSHPFFVRNYGMVGLVISIIFVIVLVLLCIFLMTTTNTLLGFGLLCGALNLLFMLVSVYIEGYSHR